MCVWGGEGGNEKRKAEQKGGQEGRTETRARKKGIGNERLQNGSKRINKGENKEERMTKTGGYKRP
jgi:hypothetical protein